LNSKLVCNPGILSGENKYQILVQLVGSLNGKRTPEYIRTLSTTAILLYGFVFIDESMVKTLSGRQENQQAVLC